MLQWWLRTNNRAHWQSRLFVCCSAVSVHSYPIVHANSETGCNTPVIYCHGLLFISCAYCIVQIVEMIIEFCKLKTNTINENNNRFFDYWFTSLIVRYLNIAGKCWRKMRLVHYRLLLMMSFISQKDGGCWTGRSMSDLAWCVTLHCERITAAKSWLRMFYFT